MIERRGDLWAQDIEGWRPGIDLPPWLVVTTNGETKANNMAIMGAGVARRAAELWPTLPETLGAKLRETGNHVYYLGVHQIPPADGEARLVRGVISFPSKHRWREMADTDLIDRSAEELVCLVEGCKNPPSVVVLPRVGTLNGKLGWAAVKPILEKHLKGDRYVVVSQ